MSLIGIEIQEKYILFLSDSIQFNSVYYSSYETFIQGNIKETRKNQRANNRKSTTNKQAKNQGAEPVVNIQAAVLATFRSGNIVKKNDSSRKSRAQLSSV